VTKDGEKKKKKKKKNNLKNKPKGAAEETSGDAKERPGDSAAGDGWIYPGIRPLEMEFASIEEGAVVRFAEHFASTLTIAPLVILVLSVMGLAPAVAPNSSKQASQAATHFGWWLFGLAKSSWSAIRRNLPKSLTSTADPIKKDALPMDAEAAAVAAANDIRRPKPRAGAGAELKWFGAKGPQKGKKGGKKPAVGLSGRRR